MRKLISFLVLLMIISILLVGCRSASDRKSSRTRRGEKVDVTLLEDLALENGYIWLYRYQDKKVTDWEFYDVKLAEELVEYINSQTVRTTERVELIDVSGPVYGMYFPHNDVGRRAIAWVDGYWIDSNGQVYQVELDFEKIFEKYPWGRESTNLTLMAFPAVYELATLNDEWNPYFLAESNKKESRGLEFEIISLEDKVLTVNMINKTKRNLSYGNSYSVEVQLDNQWYVVPSENNGLAFSLVGYGIGAGETVEKTYDLSIWGSWPKGHYRLVLEGDTVEFDWPGDMTK